MPRYKLRLQTPGEPERTADFDAGEHSYEKDDVVDLREGGRWRVVNVELFEEPSPFLAALTCVPADPA